MAQSAEDVARESIECYNAGDFDRLRSLLADDFYEEELATQRRLEGADARGRGSAGLEASVSGQLAGVLIQLFGVRLTAAHADHESSAHPLWPDAAPTP